MGRVPKRARFSTTTPPKRRNPSAATSLRRGLSRRSHPWFRPLLHLRTLNAYATLHTGRNTSTVTPCRRRAPKTTPGAASPAPQHRDGYETRPSADRDERHPCDFRSCAVIGFTGAPDRLTNQTSGADVSAARECRRVRLAGSRLPYRRRAAPQASPRTPIHRGSRPSPRLRAHGSARRAARSRRPF